ncbi:MAG: hypothetical protein PVG27_08755 [Chloroflexota bacterium]|jgi:hypothetical protein
MERDEHEGIDEEEVRRSEDELATVGNCGCAAAAAITGLVLVLVPLAWRASARATRLAS